MTIYQNIHKLQALSLKLDNDVEQLQWLASQKQWDDAAYKLGAIIAQAYMIARDAEKLMDQVAKQE